MAEQHILHKTVEGERWDQIAYQHYGDALLFQRIVEANPTIPITSTLTGGLTLVIPVLEADELLTDADLPPWKREALR